MNNEIRAKFAAIILQKTKRGRLHWYRNQDFYYADFEGHQISLNPSYPALLVRDLTNSGTVFCFSGYGNNMGKEIPEIMRPLKRLINSVESRCNTKYDENVMLGLEAFVEFQVKKHDSNS